MTEEEVIQRCQAGDRDAFRSLVDRYKDVLYGTAYLMTGSRTDAEDQVQEAFISAWKGIAGFRNGRPIKPWLVRILVNKALSHRRANNNTIPSTSVDHIADTASPDTVLSVEQQDEIERALCGLPEEQRQVILLRYFTGLSFAETSVVLGRRDGTVKSQAHRALERLKELIEANNEDNGRTK
ncbi:MAG TPA: RNA polymerase sigma factor [Dehalococcoidales bacterium]|nr:RNA polymerase sigma factor [Dehalococcoidales bacterium]